LGLPRIDEMMDEVHGVVYLSDINLDLRFHHIWMRERKVYKYIRK
jgi:hypothetical protein